MLGEEEDEAGGGEDGENGQGDFDPALGVFAGDGAGVAIDYYLIVVRTVIVGEKPDGDEDVLEGLAAVVALDLEVALGVAGDFGGAETLGFGVHFLAGGLGGGDEVYLIAFHHPAGKVSGVVGG